MDNAPSVSDHNISIAKVDGVPIPVRDESSTLTAYSLSIGR
jgi:hypothetical protein